MHCRGTCGRAAWPSVSSGIFLFNLSGTRFSRSTRSLCLALYCCCCFHFPFRYRFPAGQDLKIDGPAVGYTSRTSTSTCTPTTTETQDDDDDGDGETQASPLPAKLTCLNERARNGHVIRREKKPSSPSHSPNNWRLCWLVQSSSLARSPQTRRTQHRMPLCGSVAGSRRFPLSTSCVSHGFLNDGRHRSAPGQDFFPTPWSR
ncbi:hypothetical protein B0T22DRAFT_271507 [Podospora appendiculata]|uniref:Uncharacterized protein n=1 Tax=Podospora appendiculata TaxID=314037 RepID=A0AAE0X3J3_9PEZI|nr:hypothetical protein B0T22DRAFT_271507 [Podospora appendiculata]